MRFFSYKTSMKGKIYLSKPHNKKLLFLYVAAEVTGALLARLFVKYVIRNEALLKWTGWGMRQKWRGTI